MPRASRRRQSASSPAPTMPTSKPRATPRSFLRASTPSGIASAFPTDWTDSRPPTLAVFDPVGLHVDIYVPPSYAAQPRSIYSDEGDPGYTKHAIVVVLPQTITANAAVYLHVEPERAIPRRVEVRDVSEYRAGDLVRARLDVLFPAFQLATLLVMFAFFLALRERMYAYFVGYALCLVIYELFAFGIGYDSSDRCAGSRRWRSGHRGAPRCWRSR